jgi:hypothetical protein
VIPQPSCSNVATDEKLHHPDLHHHFFRLYILRSAGAAVFGSLDFPHSKAVECLTL